MEPRRRWEKCRVLALCAGMCEMWYMHGSRSNVPRATHHPARRPPAPQPDRATYRARGASGPPHIVPLNFHLCPQPQAKRQLQQQQQESQQRKKKLSSGCKMSAKTFSKLFTRLPFCFFFFRSFFFYRWVFAALFSCGSNPTSVECYMAKVQTEQQEEQ